MKLPRDLDGRTLVRVLCREWDYRVINQEGSHIILQTDSPSRQRIPVPDHYPMRIGTLSKILRLIAAHKGVEREDILRSL
jgi:predicted RNA binding protein YcfA (HicA-like mRNA interferase family)